MMSTVVYQIRLNCRSRIAQAKKNNLKLKRIGYRTVLIV